MVFLLHNLFLVRIKGLSRIKTKLYNTKAEFNEVSKYNFFLSGNVLFK